MIDRKARIREYKETPRPAGLFVVRNTTSGKLFVGSSRDLPGMLNRQRFQLESGGHADRELQRDWNELGPDAFTIEVLDELEPSEDPTRDIGDDLQALLELWLDKFAEAGQELYPSSRRKG